MNVGTFRQKPLVLGLLACLVAVGGALPTAAQSQEVPPAKQEQPDTPGQVRPKVALDALLRNQYEAKLLAAALKLTDEQQFRLRVLMKQNRLLLTQALTDMRLKRIALDEVLYSEELNEPLIAQRIKELAEAQTNVLTAQTRVQMQVRKLLTPEQLRTFNKLRQGEPLR